jgi:3-mercaptopyruvate sulfurtransferase SseA
MVGGAVVLAGAAALLVHSGAETQQPATASAAGPEARPAMATEAARITTDELKAAIAKNEVVIIDTRSPDAYAAGHIEGALNVPLQGLEARLKELPKTKLIAAYCT